MENQNLKIIHYLNQFFGQQGGEEKADIGRATLVKDIILGIVNIANVAEDTSDFIKALVIKYAY